MRTSVCSPVPGLVLVLLFALANPASGQEGASDGLAGAAAVKPAPPSRPSSAPT